MLGWRLHIWRRFPESETERPTLRISGYRFFGGDGGAVVEAGGRLYLPEYNGNRIVIYNQVPERAEQRPDGVIGSPDLETNTLRAEYLITNPVPATDGEALVVSSDFDRRLYLWNQRPDESGARPNWVYELPFAPWDNEIYNGSLAIAGQRAVALWRQIPRRGEMPDVYLRSRIGNERADRVHVWRGVPEAGSDPAFSLVVRQPARLTCDGQRLVVVSTETHTLHVFDVAALGADSQARTMGGSDAAAGGHQFRIR